MVKLDPYSRIPIGDIPFDRNFYLRIYFNDKSEIPKEIWLLKEFRKQPSVSSEHLAMAVIDTNSPIFADDTYLKKYFAVDVLMNPLEPDEEFSLLFIFQIDNAVRQLYLDIFTHMNAHDDVKAKAVYADAKIASDPGRPEYTDLELYFKEHKLADIFKAHTGDPGAANKAIGDLMITNDTITIKLANGKPGKQPLFQATAISSGLNTRQAKLETSAPLKLIADIGLVYCGFQKGFNVLLPYAGLSYSFRSLDSDIPFNKLKTRINFGQRFTVNAGVTLTSLAKEKYRSNIFGSSNIMVGGGFRISHAISLTGGVLFYNNVNPNPLLDKKTLAVAPYAGLSVNLKLKNTLGQIANVFTYGK